MAATVTKPAGLSAEEMKALNDLAARAGLTLGKPPPRTGSVWQALVNISVPRPGDPDKATDLVMAGNTVTLTDEQAAKFLPPNKQVALIRKKAESGQPLPRITGRHLAGRLNGPPADVRPDPAGSSRVIKTEEAVIPEMTEPGPGGEEDKLPDAIDLPPGTRVTGGISRVT